MDMTLFTVAVCAVAVIAGLIARWLYRDNQRLRRENASLARPLYRTIHKPEATPPRKSAEQQQAEHLDRQFEAVMREQVTFSKSRVMGSRGEYELFRAALTVTGQPLPKGYYAFPQVSLGQIIRTLAQNEWAADQAHRAINSKRCDLLLADRNGIPIAVLEFQGAGHDIGGTARKRDTIKRIALERAGVRYVEITEGTTQAEMQQTIRDLLTAPPEKERAAAPVP